MTLFAEQLFDLAGSDEKVAARLYAPVRSVAQTSWICRFEIGPPIAYAREIHGETALQALALGLKCLSAALYSRDLYRNGGLGAFGAFRGYLGIPAPQSFLDEAPFPF